MKVHLKKMLSLAALGMSLFTTTVPTWAGFVSTPEVYIGVNGNGLSYARGSMVGARYSADNTQRIACRITFDSSIPNLYMECFAADSGGKLLSCSSAAPEYLEAVQAMTDSSYIYFEVGRYGQCRGVSITDSSGLLK